MSFMIDFFIEIQKQTQYLPKTQLHNENIFIPIKAIAMQQK